MHQVRLCVSNASRILVFLTALLTVRLFASRTSIGIIYRELFRVTNLIINLRYDGRRVVFGVALCMIETYHRDVKYKNPVRNPLPLLRRY